MTVTVPASPKTSAGFTLVEMVMAMLVMTVGLLGLLQSVNIAYEHSLRTRLREQAMLLAEQQMNDLRNRPPSENNYLSQTTILREIGGVAKPFKVTLASDSMGATTKRLRISVGWSFKNETMTHSIYTLKTM